MVFRVAPGYELDLSDRISVPIVGTGGDTYAPLAPRQRSTLISAIQERYQFPSPQEELDRAFWHYLRDWKLNGLGVGAKRHEAIVKREFAIDPAIEIRGGPIDWTPTGAMCNAMRMLHAVSTAFLREHFGAELTVYRGLSHETPQIMQSLLADPSVSTVCPDQSVLSNYSTSKNGAAYFSRLVTRQCLPPSDIALAANFLFAYDAYSFERHSREIDTREAILSPNAELRVRNDREYPYEVSDLYVAVGDPTTAAGVTLQPLSSILSSLTSLTPEEHAALGTVFQTCIDALPTDQQQISSPLPLADWERAFRRECGISPPEISSLTI